MFSLWFILFSRISNASSRFVVTRLGMNRSLFPCRRADDGGVEFVGGRLGVCILTVGDCPTTKIDEVVTRLLNGDIGS